MPLGEAGCVLPAVCTASRRDTAAPPGHVPIRTPKLNEGPALGGDAPVVASDVGVELDDMVP